jgi:hypothetical protein
MLKSKHNGRPLTAKELRDTAEIAIADDAMERMGGHGDASPRTRRGKRPQDL